MGDRGKTPAPFVGRWRIIESELWSSESLDLVAPAHITFADGAVALLEMVSIRAALECCFVSARRVEFSWLGEDDGGEAMEGHGIGEIDADGTLRGTLFLPEREESWFLAIPEDS